MSTISKPFTPYPSTQASYLSQRNGGTFTSQATKELETLVEKQQALLIKEVPNADLTDFFSPSVLSTFLEHAINPVFENYTRSESAIQDHIASLKIELSSIEEQISKAQNYLAPPQITKPKSGFLGLFSNTQKNNPSNDTFIQRTKQDLMKYQQWQSQLQARIEALRVERSAEDLEEFHKTWAFQKGVQDFQGATPKTWLGKLIQYVKKNTPDGNINVTSPHKKRVTIEHEDKTVGQILTLPTPFRLQEEINSIRGKHPNHSEGLLYGKMIELPYLNPTGRVITQLNPRAPREI